MEEVLVPKFDERGLTPAVVQDVNTGQVLMLAWMNAEAFEKTLSTRQAHFWSRSRQELWRKGGVSGNVQNVAEVAIDCDLDALLLRVHPAGPACHTGQESCFYRKVELAPSAPAEAEASSGRSFSFGDLFSLIQDRRKNPAASSYTSGLFRQGEHEIAKKVGEEAVEVVLAAAAQGDERLVEEISDLVFHTMVLMVERGLSFADVEEELARRHR